MTKFTKRSNFEALLTVVSTAVTDATELDRLTDFINHEIELLEKKNSGEKKPTAQQVANDAIRKEILDNMVEGKQYTITDIIKEIPACADLTNQRVSALMRQLIEDKMVVRTEDKRKAYFSLA